MTQKRQTRLGQLKPRYRFFLNPYKEHRFTNCPQCDRRMKVRKNPFFIHIDPDQVLVLNMYGKYCPRCDLLILHQDKVEELLTAAMFRHKPDVIGNDYLVVGTIERKAWREGTKQPQNLKKVFENLHDFKEAVLVEVQPAGWYPDED